MSKFCISMVTLSEFKYALPLLEVIAILTTILVEEIEISF